MDKAWFDEMEARIPHGGVRTRFAPSPTGYMHVGNLRTALYTYLIARNAGGTFILRIEDTDQQRLVEGAVEKIYRGLELCGLDHDEGPDVGGPVGPYIQSERRDFYGRYARRLVERGCAYYCFCDKPDSDPDLDKNENKDENKGENNFEHKEDPCRHLSLEEAEARIAAGASYVIRQRIPDSGQTTFHDEIFGDITVENSSLDEQVLLKSDGLPTYNFANVIDDHLMGITHVVRGSEYLSSTPKYNLLYEGFGWPVPAYIHVSPVMRDAHNKMSKRHGDPSFEDLLEAGYLPEAIVNYVVLLGWSPRGDIAEREIFSLRDLISVFDIAGISKSPAIFDHDKLRHFNSEYIRALSPEDFARIALPYIRTGCKNEAYDPAAIAALLQQRCELLTEIPEKIDFFDALPDYDPALFTHKKSKSTLESSHSFLEQMYPVLAALPVWDHDSVLAALNQLAESAGCKIAKVMWPLRIAISGKAVTPGGAVEIACILGKDESLRRIQYALDHAF